MLSVVVVVTSLGPANRSCGQTFSVERVVLMLSSHLFRHWVGDSHTSFTMQSGNKCFTYALAVDEYGSDAVHSHIGKEPSGASFNKLVFNSDGTASQLKP